MESVDGVDREIKARNQGKNYEIFMHKKIHIISSRKCEYDVDCVDNLLAKKVFAYFHDVSGTHSYQQVAVDTIF